MISFDVRIWRARPRSSRYMSSVTDHAKTFRQLHHQPRVFLVVNCWDAASARVLQELGAPAIATTSAGLCWANGYPDGATLPRDTLLASVRSIQRVLRVPLTVDIEGGYSDDPAAVTDTVAALLDAGVAGINLEDGTSPPEVLARKIERIKQRAGASLFVNARCDVYIRGLVPEAARAEETLARGQRYRDAGADGLFVPKLVDAAEIRRIASAIDLPLNVLAWPGLPPTGELYALGVRRMSSGSALAQLALGTVRAAATAFLDGQLEPLAAAMPYADINRLFPRS